MPFFTTSSNQSSGYCPEPASHAPLRLALAALGSKRAPAFEPSCEWRRCMACGQINDDAARLRASRSAA